MISYARVLGALEVDGARRVALERFAAATGDRDRWGPRDRAVMADALSYAEDWLEIERPRADRSALRAVRRALEAELR